MIKMHDIIVIGAGAGGLNIASFMNKVGFKVLLVEKEDKKIGGDCLNTGCVPSKALIHISKLIKNSKQAEKFSLTKTGKVDLAKVMKYVNEKREFIRKHENADYFRKQGIDIALGTAKFVSKNSIRVNEITYSAKKIIIATGSRPKILDVPGMKKVNYLTNENIFELKKLPKHLVVVGGGPIGLELGQAFRRLGSEVTILIRGDKFLPKESKEVADILLEQLKKEGIEVLFNTHITKFTSSNEALLNNKSKINFNEILISIGRDRNFKDLDLEKAGIQYNEKGILRDILLRTTNKDVLLSGDIVGGYMFTHSAELHASIIINNFFSPFKKEFSQDKFAWVTFTDPEIATFGLNEEQLKQRRIKYEKLEMPFAHDDRAIVDDSPEGKLILFISSKNRILGGTMIGTGAGELSQELIFAMANDLPIKSFLNKIYPYPTATRINKAIIGSHIMKKISPFTKKILKFLY